MRERRGYLSQKKNDLFVILILEVNKIQYDCAALSLRGQFRRLCNFNILVVNSRYLA